MSSEMEELVRSSKRVKVIRVSTCRDYPNCLVSHPCKVYYLLGDDGAIDDFIKDHVANSDEYHRRIM